jgi:L-asparaginase
VHAARYVRKTHTSSPGAFSSPLCGRLGWVSEGQVRFCFELPKMPALAAAVESREARVALVTVALGDDGMQIEALAAAQIDGIVVEATGGGHVPLGVATALGEAARQIPVVLASRTGAGETLARTYGFPGGEIDLQQRGLIRSGWLDGLKSKVLLTLMLRRGLAGRDVIAEAFQPWGGGRSS